MRTWGHEEIPISQAHRQRDRIKDDDAGTHDSNSIIAGRPIVSLEDTSTVPTTVMLAEIGGDRLQHRLKTVTSQRDEAQRQLVWAQERHQFEEDLREIMKQQFSAFHHQLSDATYYVVSEFKTTLSAELKQVSTKTDVSLIRQLDHMNALLKNSAESVSTVLGAVHELKARTDFSILHSAIEETRRTVETFPMQKIIQDHKLEVDRHFSHVCNLIRGSQSVDLAPVMNAVQDIKALGPSSRQQPQEIFKLEQIMKAIRDLAESRETMESCASQFRKECDRNKDRGLSSDIVEEVARNLNAQISLEFTKVQDAIRQRSSDVNPIVSEDVVRKLNTQISQEFAKMQDAIRRCSQEPNLAVVLDAIKKHSDAVNHEMQKAIVKHGEKVNDEIHDAIDKHNEQFMDRFVRLHEALLKKQSDMSETMRVHNGQTRQYYDQVHFATVIDAIRKHIEQVIQKLAEISRQQTKAQVQVDIRPECDKMHEAIASHSKHMVDSFARLHEALLQKQQNASHEVATNALSNVDEKLQSYLEKASGAIERNADTLLQNDVRSLGVQISAMNEKLSKISDMEKTASPPTQNKARSEDLQIVHKAIEDLRGELEFDNFNRASQKQADADILPDVHKMLEEIKNAIQEVKVVVEEIKEGADDLQSLPDISSTPANNTKARKSIAFQELKFSQAAETARMMSQLDQVKEEMTKMLHPESLRKSMAAVMIDLRPELMVRSCAQCYCETANGSWAEGNWYCQRCHDEWVYEHVESVEAQVQETSKAKPKIARGVTFESGIASDSEQSESEASLGSVRSDVEVVDLIEMMQAETKT